MVNTITGGNGHWWGLKLRQFPENRFYVNIAGSDAADGKSEANAWTTLDKVRSYGYTPGFAAGDHILLNGGDTWREQLKHYESAGLPGARIVYDAYGTGAKPVIMGSQDLSATGVWTSLGSNVWQATTASQVGNLIMNSEAVIGVKQATLVACDAQGDYYSPPDSTYIKMYSVGNPGTFYTHIEAATADFGRMNQNYVTLRNLAFKYHGWHGIVPQATTGATIEYCDFKYIGGCDDGDGYRDGNGIMAYQSTHDFTCRYCTFDNIWETAISHQSSGSGISHTNLYEHHNIFTQCGKCVDLWVYSSSSNTCDNWRWVNNVMFDTGGGSFLAQYTNGLFSNNVGGLQAVRIHPIGIVTNSKVQNNIFAGTAAAYVTVPVDWAYSIAGVDIDYNCYYPDGAAFFSFENTDTNFAGWKSGTGKDAHSIITNPTFVGASDFHLQAGSPCINAGTDVGMGFPVLGAAPDMGIYEEV
jgi:hypothetical protein